MKSPFISVLVTVYNQGRFIRESLESVLAQTYRDYELIVTDDRSTDDSADEILKVQDRRIQFIHRAVNSGLANIPRNEMIRMARGKYIALLDGDDIWFPDKLKEQVSFMERHPEYLFSHTQCMVVDEQGRDLYIRNHGNYPVSGDCFEDLMRKCFICTSTVMFDRRLIARVGFMSEDPQLRNGGDDQEFFLRCAKVGSVGLTPGGILAKYRWDPNSLCHHPSRWRPGFDLLSRRDLWEGRMSECAVRQIICDNSAERSYYWRQRGCFYRSAWFARRMIQTLPLRAEGWRLVLASIARKR